MRDGQASFCKAVPIWPDAAAGTEESPRGHRRAADRARSVGSDPVTLPPFVLHARFTGSVFGKNRFRHPNDCSSRRAHTTESEEYMTEHKHAVHGFFRAIALVLTIGLLCGMALPARAASALPFDDVKPGRWYYDAVLWAYGQGITSGTSETTFSPHQELSYAQTSLFLYRYAYSPAPHFRFAEAFAACRDRYYYDSINWACDFDIIALNEVANGNRPGTKLNRNQFVNILYRYAAGWEHRSVAVDGNYLGAYEDAPSDETEWKAWNWAVKIGMISGTSATTLSPEKTLTRAEFVLMLYRYETQAAMLQGETLIGMHLRGWQRTLLETGELAYGVPWVDYAYELGPDGIPTKIDCSGILEWAFCWSGIYNVPDLESWQLWDSDHFIRVFTRNTGSGGFTETGYTFINRVRSGMQPGDLIFCGFNESTYHVMMYLGSDSSKVYVFHSRAGVGVCVEALPNTVSSYYLKNIYGVKRHIP